MRSGLFDGPREGAVRLVEEQVGERDARADGERRVHAVPGACHRPLLGRVDFRTHEERAPRRPRDQHAGRRRIVHDLAVVGRLLVRRDDERRREPPAGELLRDARVVRHHDERGVAALEHRLLVLERRERDRIGRRVTRDHRRKLQAPVRRIGERRIVQHESRRHVPVGRNRFVARDVAQYLTPLRPAARHAHREAAPGRAARGAHAPRARPAEPQHQFEVVLLRIGDHDARCVAEHHLHRLARVVLGARVVAVERIERPREEPDAVLERVAAGSAAGESAVLLPCVVVDEQVDVAPVAAFARQHLGERPRVRTVGRGVASEQVQRESREDVAPPAADLALPGGGERAVRAAGLLQVADALLGDPTVRRRVHRYAVEHRDEELLALPDDRWLHGRRRSLLVVPVADVAHLLVALRGAALPRGRQVREPELLELGLCAPHGIHAGRRTRVRRRRSDRTGIAENLRARGRRSGRDEQQHQD